jgi:hypothetical protein
MRGVEACKRMVRCGYVQRRVLLMGRRTFARRINGRRQRSGALLQSNPASGEIRSEKTRWRVVGCSSDERAREMMPTAMRARKTSQFDAHRHWSLSRTAHNRAPIWQLSG